MKVDAEVKSDLMQNLPTYCSNNLVNMSANANKTKKVAAKLKHGLWVLPSLFTLGNAFFGFTSIVCAAGGEELFFASAYFILLGAMMDSFDGRVARMTGTSSRMGLELDSLADSATFCLAPAFLCYKWQLKSFGILGLIICAVFFLSGILRLARFNVMHEQQSKFFIGLPTTIAACFLASIVICVDPDLLKFHFVPLFAVVILLLACAMICSISFPTFKHLKGRTFFMVVLFIGAVSVAFGFNTVLLVLFLLYFLSPVTYALFGKLRDWNGERNS